MHQGKLAQIADRMATEDFVVDLYLARLKMDAAWREDARYDETNLARDLGIPVPIALILIRFLAATEAESRMSRIVEDKFRSEARH